MAGGNLLLAICALATLGICYSQVLPAGGRVNVLSVNESLELFCTTTDWSVSPFFSATLDISLRAPCPSCHPSYNYIVHTDQLIVPSTGLVSFFTFLSEEPFVYTQVVPIPNCEPLSIYEPPLSPNLLYLDCKDLQNNRNFFLAQLERFQLSGKSDKEDYVWIFSTLPGFQSLEEAGTYAGIMGFSSFMMLYVHEAQEDHIELNGFLTGYISILTKPEECSNIVRITATGTSEDNKLLLECSDTETELVSTLYILDSVTSMHLLTTQSPYKICPMRFSPNGSVVAIFTEFYIVVIDLVSESYTNVTVNQSIYDGVVSQSSSGSNTLYLVYSTMDGLYRVTVSLTTTKTTKRRIEIGSVSIFPDTGTVCAKEGCPLMYMVNEDLILAAVDSVVSLFSIASLKKAAGDITTQHPPSRFMFQSAINDTLCRVISPSVCPVTSSLDVTVVPSLQSVITMHHGNAEWLMGTSARGQATKTAVAVVATAVATVIGIAILITLLLITARRKYLSSAAIARYKRSSDEVELISSALGSSPESMDSSFQPSTCSTDSGVDNDCATTSDSDSKCKLLLTRENVDSTEINQIAVENEETSIGQLNEDAWVLCATQEVGKGDQNHPLISKKTCLTI